MTVRETEYKLALKRLNKNPDIVICDSQVVDKMVEATPSEITATTFSILFTRLKGDLNEMVKGARILDGIEDSSRILIAEACTHHPSADDIGRIKLPRWIREYTGKDPKIEICSGKDFPRDLGSFDLIIHCGGCMINRRLMLSRIERAKLAGVPITNYGVAISGMKGVLQRVLSPFPEVLSEGLK
jgi:[FeFe] hydrogenase H-cluster maturation GTPase HydF